MANWKGNNPPFWHTRTGKDAVATKKGWENPKTGEVLIAVSSLNTRMGAADVIGINFVSDLLARGDELSLTVKFNEKVDVTAGASVVVTNTGLAGNITLYAVAQLSAYDIIFDKDVTLLAPVLLADEAATLSVDAQTVLGTVKDAGTAVDSNLAISVDVAAAAGTREII